MGSLNILCVLIAIASITGAFIHAGVKSTGANTSSSSNVEEINRIKNQADQINQLQQEILTLRELAESTGDFIVSADWLTFIEKTGGYSFKKYPQVIRGIEDEFLKSAGSAWASYFSEAGMIDRQYALSAIGLIPEGNLLMQLALAESGPGTRRSLFDYERGCILIAHDFDEKNIFDRTSLSNSLSIALLEQNFPVVEGLSDDAWFARRMVVHGYASSIKQSHWTQMQREFQLNGSEIKSPISEEEFRNSELDFKELPLFVRESITAHAAWGRSFIEAQDPESSIPLFEQALKKAHTTSSILQGKEIPENRLDKKEDTILQNSLGAFSILIHASLGETIKSPLEIAKSWVSDRIEFKENKKENALEVTWTIRFSSLSSAKQFSGHLKDLDETLQISRKDGVVTAFSQKKLL